MILTECICLAGTALQLSMGQQAVAWGAQCWLCGGRHPLEAQPAGLHGKTPHTSTMATLLACCSAAAGGRERWPCTTGDVRLVHQQSCMHKLT